MINHKKLDKQAQSEWIHRSKDKHDTAFNRMLANVCAVGFFVYVVAYTFTGGF